MKYKKENKYTAKNVSIIQNINEIADANKLYYLPMDTIDVISHLNIDNFNLKLNKTVYFKKDKKEPDIKQAMGKNLKNLTFPYMEDFISKKRKMFEYLEEHLSLNKFIFKTSWRMAVGLGEESVYQVSMKLDHIYGWPYIPGSAFKGAVRSWVINEYFNGEEGDRSNGALSSKAFCKIFGALQNSITGEQMGEAIFFDAFPINSPKIHLDLINNHYEPYYNKKSSVPGDYYNPIMVNFLTVKDTAFEFYYGFNKNCTEIIEDEKLSFKANLRELVKKFIKEALEEQGIGAKTSVGYGYMEEAPEVC